MSILIGADIVPTESNKAYFDSGDMQYVVGEELTKMLGNSEYRIFNLECPLVNTDSPIQKCGPNLRADVSTVNGLKSVGVDLLTIANNHIMDHGNAGLESTISVLEKENISFLGAGKNLKAAVKHFVFSANNKKIGVYACAEHEFSIAEKNKSGANPFDPLESFDHVVNIKKDCDFVIVLYHGGKEHYRYPSPMLQRFCRKFVEKGADLVVCQHSHCIGCEEKYYAGTIVYGQGNFIFDSQSNLMSDTALLIKVDDDFKIEYIPLEKYGCGVRLAKDDVAKKILSDFNQRSELIKNAQFIEDEYSKFSKKMLNGYLLPLSGYNHNFIKRLLKKLFGRRAMNYLVDHSFTSKEKLFFQAIIQSEAHYELLLNGLKIKNKDYNNETF